jgi:hypothetical protein
MVEAFLEGRQPEGMTLPDVALWVVARGEKTDDGEVTTRPRPLRDSRRAVVAGRMRFSLPHSYPKCTLQAVTAWGIFGGHHRTRCGAH